MNDVSIMPVGGESVVDRPTELEFQQIRTSDQARNWVSREAAWQRDQILPGLLEQRALGLRAQDDNMLLINQITSQSNILEAQARNVDQALESEAESRKKIITFVLVGVGLYFIFKKGKR